MSSTAKEIYDSINTYNDILELLSKKKEESDHLEFKLANLDYNKTKEKENKFVLLGKGILNLRDSDNWRRALSGFANSDGGVLIWGVNANDKNENDLDHVIGVCPISNPNKFKQNLEKLILDFIKPFLEGILLHVIIDEKDKTLGFIKCYIPKSEGIHMAGDNKYYKRVRDSFFAMEHWEVENLFGRNSKPKLSLIVNPSIYTGENLDKDIFQFELALLNDGKAAAKSVMVWVEIKNVTIIMISEQIQNITKLNYKKEVIQYTNNESVFHPSGMRSIFGQIAVKIIEQEKPIDFKFKIFAENMSVIENTISYYNSKELFERLAQENIILK